MTGKLVTFHIVGDAFVDLFSFLDGDWPEKGGDSQLSHAVNTVAGGSSTNTTTHLQSLIRMFGWQESTKLILHTTLNPNDHYGEILLKHAEKHGYPLVNCKKEDDSSATGHCVAIVAGQERSFMTYRGCVGTFDAKNLEITSIVNADCPVHLHVAGFYNLSGFQGGLITERLREIRERRGCKETVISLVPQHDATKVWDGGIDELSQLVDFLIMNDLEAMHIMRQGKIRNGMAKSPDSNNHPSETNPESSMQDCAEYFGKICPKTWIILTRGPAGAVVLHEGSIVLNQGTVKVSPIDPTGAGDSFSAGFLYGIWAWRNQTGDVLSNNSWKLEGLKQGLQWGCALGTSSVLIRGASIPACKDDIQRLHDDIEKLSG